MNPAISSISNMKNTFLEALIDISSLCSDLLISIAAVNKKEWKIHAGMLFFHSSGQSMEKTAVLFNKLQNSVGTVHKSNPETMFL